MKEKDIPSNNGHRQRIKDSFIDNYHSNINLDDDKLLEILLFYSIPRKDVKPLAKQLTTHFGNLQNVLHASYEELSEFIGINKNTYTLFLAIRTSFLHILKKQALTNPILNQWQHVLDYCYAHLAYEKKEYLKILYLNSKNYLIKDEIIQEGTIHYVNIYPREIVKKVLNAGASAFILVHNHPSGDASPSVDDIKTTSELKKIAKNLEISLHDHVIISKSRIISFKELGILV